MRGARGVGLAAGVVALAALGLMGCTGSGSDRAARSTEADEQARRTTTTATIEGHAYAVGDCVMFDQLATGAANDAAIVGCTTSHVLEVVGLVEVTAPGDRWPGRERLRALVDARCEKAARSYLGQAHLENGRFLRYDLGITPQGWAAGERTYRCGLADMDERAPGNRPLAVLTEISVEGRSQIEDPPVGECQSSLDQVRADPGQPSVVPCGQPHGREVTGEVPVTEDHWDPDADVDANAARLDAGCERALEAYAGPSHPGVHATYLGITEEAMALGDRDISCLAVGDDDALLTRSVRAG